MGGCYSIDGVLPVVDPSAFVHPDAVLIGDVRVGPRCYVGPLASLRGDMGRIELHEGSNVQDGCVLHCFPGRETVVEADGHIGHGAVLHGCRIGRGSLIGINAVLLDGVRVGATAFVGAHSFLKSGFEVPAGWLAAGSPAKVQRELTHDEKRWKANGTAVYQELAARSLATMRRVEPLTEPAAERATLAIGAERARPLSEFRDASNADQATPGAEGQR